MSTKDIKFWLEEKDLKTPEHDEIVLWAFNNINKFISEDVIKDFEIEKKIEYAIGGSYNIGFIDLAILCNLNKRLMTGEFSELEKKYRDVCIKLHNEYSYDFTGRLQVYIEVKPKIDSIGEVLRQISYYRKYLPFNHHFVLITKTKGLKDLFKTQGIDVIEYESKKEEKNGSLL